MGSSAMLPLPAETTPPAWAFNAALERYNALGRAWEVDLESGSLGQAYQAFDQVVEPLKSKFGSKDACPPNERTAWDAAYKILEKVERQHIENSGRPRWDAADMLFATPAPSVPAIIQKLVVWKVEGGEAADIIALVEADSLALREAMQARIGGCRSTGA